MLDRVAPQPSIDSSVLRAVRALSPTEQRHVERAMRNDDRPDEAAHLCALRLSRTYLPDPPSDGMADVIARYAQLAGQPLPGIWPLDGEVMRREMLRVAIYDDDLCGQSLDGIDETERLLAERIGETAERLIDHAHVAAQQQVTSELRRAFFEGAGPDTPDALADLCDGLFDDLQLREDISDLEYLRRAATVEQLGGVLYEQLRNGLTDRQQARERLVAALPVCYQRAAQLLGGSDTPS